MLIISCINCPGPPCAPVLPSAGTPQGQGQPQRGRTWSLGPSLVQQSCAGDRVGLTRGGVGVRLTQASLHTAGAQPQ